MKKVVRINNDFPNRETYGHSARFSHLPEFPLPANVKTTYPLSDRDKPTAPDEYAESFPDEAVENAITIVK